MVTKQRVPPVTDSDELDNVYAISQVVSQAGDWKTALDQITPLIRAIFIYDNLALYRLNPVSNILEATYARAVGRGRTSGEDLAWGESVANQVYSTGQVIFQNPDIPTEIAGERLKKPYLLGIPLQSTHHILGVLVFIRFGGPAYNNDHTRIASYISNQITHLVEREELKKQFDQIEAEQKQIRLQEDFISTVTHELLTPLGFIKGYSSTLLRSDTTWDAASQKEFLTIIDQEADRLQELIDNLLDSARLQSGTMQMEFQPVRLDALIKDVVVRARAQNRGLQVKLEVPPLLSPITGDPRRLSQVLENLMNNTVKYAPNSPIHIRIQKYADSVEIIFQDFGPGIPAKYMPYVFDRFFRNPEQAPNIHGSGLGLFICRQIVHAHSGEITVESTVGEGTTFTIRLPLNPSGNKTADRGV